MGEMKAKANENAVRHVNSRNRRPVGAAVGV
jgi:hypothetical protein